MRGSLFSLQNERTRAEPHHRVGQSHQQFSRVTDACDATECRSATLPSPCHVSGRELFHLAFAQWTAFTDCRPYTRNQIRQHIEAIGGRLEPGTPLDTLRSAHVHPEADRDPLEG